MARPTHPDPSPFLLEGGRVGVLLIHGFTGSPPEMGLLGEYLHHRGLTVSAPLLPGHGTTVDQMNRCRWTDWTGHAEQALADLRSRCETIFIGGLSMGSLITIYLAAQYQPQGAILYSPAVKVANPLIHLAPAMKYLVRRRPKPDGSDLVEPLIEERTWSYEYFPSFAAHELLKLIGRSRDLLPELSCPLLVVHSTGDDVIRADSAQYAYERAGSSDKKLVKLHDSGHVLTVDREWETVAEETYRFIQAHVSAEG
jgi:carboxylesterase